MSKKVYLGKDTAARRVKRVYLGVEGVARRVRRAYIGIEGVARACLGPGVPVFVGTAEPLGAVSKLSAAAMAGERLLFAGGSRSANSGFQSAVTAYDAHLTKTLPEALGTARQNLSGASAGGKALFAGGDRNTQWSSTVDVYDGELIRSTASLSVARGKMAEGSVGGCAVFAGGFGSSAKDTVDFFSADLTRSESTLSSKRYNCAGAGAGTYFLAAGGTSTVKTVDAFDESLTRTAVEDLSVGRYSMRGLTHMGKAMIVGGWGDSGAVDVYDGSLTHLVLAAVNVKAYACGAVLENCAIFHGGRDGDNEFYTNTVVFDESFTATAGPDLSTARWGESVGTVGEYALFAGGDNDGAAEDTVDVFRLD